MKVICINKIRYIYGSYKFTKNNMYDVRVSKSNNEIYIITDDNDRDFWFVPGLSENFMFLNEIRKKKLEKLNEKISLL